MLNILVVIGKSQYDSTKIFLDEIIQEFQNYTIQLDILSSYDFKTFEKNRNHYLHKNYDIILTINGMLLEEKSALTHALFKNQPLYCTILMDHPYVHHKRLCNLYSHSLVLCPDYQHVEYLSTYYPHIAYEGFLAHGGCKASTILPYEKHSIPVSFLGSYQSPQNILETINKYPSQMRSLFYEIIDFLKVNSSSTLEQALITILNNHNISCPINLFASVCSDFYLADTYIRCYYREKIIQTIVNAGIPVHVYGDGWDSLDIVTTAPLYIHPRINFRDSLAITANSKLSLNIMPWFKNGSHDRIFTSMLCNTVCLTDSSQYLKSICTDKKNILFYELNQLEVLPEQIHSYLTNPEKSCKIALNGRNYAQASHTWKKRAQELIEYFSIVL